MPDPDNTQDIDQPSGDTEQEKPTLDCPACGSDRMYDRIGGCAHPWHFLVFHDPRIEQVATELEDRADAAEGMGGWANTYAADAYREAAALIRHNPTADADSVPGGSDLEEQSP